MKTLVSYVLQDQKGHQHLSEVLDIREPPITYSPDPPVSQIMKWADEKRQELSPDKQLIILSIYKI